MRVYTFIFMLCLTMCGCRPENATPSSMSNGTKVNPQDLRDQIQQDISGGYLTEDEIVTTAVEVFSDQEDAETLKPQATEITRELMANHIRVQQSWPAITDCDRLDAAFSKLESSGVVSRQDFSCCGNCGSGEIFDEIKRETSKGKKVHGYTFFHSQDTDSAVDGYGLYLNFGGIEYGERPALQVGQQIAGALKEQGLKVDWDGTWKTRIHVTIDWKRRRS